MKRDPLYQEIIERLSGPLDPDNFERCACDLLRDTFPGLVPIRGGTDWGMDGVIADGNGPPLSLVATTDEDVIGNLTKSLDRYLETGGLRREAVLATSEQLNRRRRSNLESRAAEKKFQLLQIIDRAGIADRLYHDASWTLELLGLSGDPPALSRTPKTHRSSKDLPLIGRDAEREWLTRRNGDKLLIGQPGSGKTFLCSAVAQELDGYYVVRTDLKGVAVDLRKLAPHTLFLDDAHTCLDFISELIWLRRDRGLSFAIVATCWPGAMHLAADRMGIPPNDADKIRELSQLTRDEIAEIVRATGMRGPNELVQEIVVQSEGKPGLAVTLATTCLTSGVRDLASGELLLQYGRAFTELVGPDALSILAVFALGGDWGMRVSDVASSLKMPENEVRRYVTNLAAGGVIREDAARRLSVRPYRLRHILIKDVFYGGPGSVDLSEVRSFVPSIGQLTEGLIGAKALGADVPEAILREGLIKANDVTLWNEYAFLGDEQARHATEIVGGIHLESIAAPALLHVPDYAIPRLLDAAARVEITDSINRNRFCKEIEGWILTSPPNSRAAVERRRALLKAGQRWCNGNPDRDQISTFALSFAMTPGFDRSELVAGSGNAFVVQRGLLSETSLGEVAQLWAEVATALQQVEHLDWTQLFELLHKWTYPYLSGSEPSPKSRILMRDVAKSMVATLSQIANGRQGILRRLRSYAIHMEMQIDFSISPDFDLLFFEFERGDLHQQQRELADRISALAIDWNQKGAMFAATRLSELLREGSLGSVHMHNWVPNLCTKVRDLTETPEDWLSAMLCANHDAPLVHIFLEPVVLLRRPGWENAIETCLSSDKYSMAAAAIIFVAEQIDESLLARAIDCVSAHPERVREILWFNRTSDTAIMALLRHPNDELSAFTAIGEWESTTTHEIRGCARVEWAAAILRCKKWDHSLRLILDEYPHLKVEWLAARIANANTERDLHEGDWLVSIDGIDDANREKLVDLIPEKCRDGDLVKALIGQRPNLYARFLETRARRAISTAPLQGRPSEQWAILAQTALDAGLDEAEIANAPFVGERSWSGLRSTMYKGEMDAFTTLLNHADPRIRHIAEIGYTSRKEMFERALKEERREEIECW